MVDLFQVVGNVGFPIVVSIYLLVRIEGKLEVLSTSINQLSQAIGEMKN